MLRKMNELAALVGGLSEPSKMPGFSYGTPAKECGVGSILRTRAGSVCSKCYARKGMYVFPVVQAAQYKRLKILTENLSAWTTDMTELLRRKYFRKTGDARVFRWHDSGDIQSAAHLGAIVRIAQNLPDIRFWLPTKEYALVRQYVRDNGSFPANLVVRVSAPMIGQENVAIPGTVSSTVGYENGFQCEAYIRGGKCGDCRACWKKEIVSVNYPQH